MLTVNFEGGTLTSIARETNPEAGENSGGEHLRKIKREYFKFNYVSLVVSVGAEVSEASVADAAPRGSHEGFPFAPRPACNQQHSIARRGDFRCDLERTYRRVFG